MGLKRILHFGNTEEIYRFCPEEILYMQAVNGKEETMVFLINNQDCYIIPNGIGNVSQVIDNALLKTNNSMCKIGRSTIINLIYLRDIGKDTIHLEATADGKSMKEDVKISVDACKKLAVQRNASKEAQKKYQQTHFQGGYVERSSGGGGFGYTGFMIREFEPCARPESYYNIDDDEIMFLGV